MRRLVLTGCIALLWACHPGVCFAETEYPTTVPRVVESDTPEVLFRDFLLTMLTPYIQKAIDDHSPSEARNFALYDAEITNLTRRCAYGQYYFKATVVIQTFTGPRRPPYGIETITLTNFPPKKVRPFPYQPNVYVIDYQHRNVDYPTAPIRSNCPPK